MLSHSTVCKLNAYCSHSNRQLLIVITFFCLEISDFNSSVVSYCPIAQKPLKFWTKKIEVSIIFSAMWKSVYLQSKITYILLVSFHCVSESLPEHAVINLPVLFYCIAVVLPTILAVFTIFVHLWPMSLTFVFAELKIWFKW